MKKYNSIFVCSSIAAILSILSSMLVFSLASHVPAFVNKELSNTVFSGGISGPVITVLMIVLPVCFILFSFVALRSYKKAINESGICATLETKRKYFSAVHLFIICSSVITLASLIYAGVHRNTIWDHQISSFGIDAYMDFFNHITYARYPSETYAQTMHACFPPLAYVMYFLISRILPIDSTVKFHSELTSHYAMLTYIIYMVILVILLAFIIKKVLSSFGDGISLGVTILIALSSVFIYNTERGNSVLLVLILLLASMYLRESDKAWKKELALILIAVAAGFKIYPAIFGLLYIVEKRWKEAIRLVIYGVAFFFIPFIFFGGLDGMKLFLENQLAVQNEGYASLTSVSSMARLIVDTITGSPDNYGFIPVASTMIFILLCVIAFFNKKLDIWEKAMLLISLISFAPAWSGRYTAIFFALPMLLFFRDCRNGFGSGITKAYRITCGVLFAVAFSMITFVTPNGTSLYETRYIALHIINLLVIVKSAHGYIRLLPQRKKIKT